MACFVGPLAEAVVVTVVKKVVDKKEGKNKEGKNKENDTSVKRFSWSQRLSWLKSMLWGGSLLLILEHIWHGEVVLWPPFLTAMMNPDDIAPMKHEILTIGTAMSVFVTLIWVVMVIVAEQRSKTTNKILIKN